MVTLSSSLESNQKILIYLSDLAHHFSGTKSLRLLRSPVLAAAMIYELKRTVPLPSPFDWVRPMSRGEGH